MAESLDPNASWPRHLQESWRGPLLMGASSMWFPYPPSLVTVLCTNPVSKETGSDIAVASRHCSGIIRDAHRRAHGIRLVVLVASGGEADKRLIDVEAP